MDASQQPEFDAQMGALFGAWGRAYSPGLQTGYWKGLQRLSLADVARCVDRAIERFGEEPDMRLPTVGELWAIKRSLRAAAPVRREPEPVWDRWDVAANRHLLAHLQRNARTLCPNGKPDEACAAKVAPLVAAKNRWAALMRDCQDAQGNVDPAEQADLWESMLEHA